MCVPSSIWDIANTIIRFTENVLRQEGEDTVDTLKTMRTKHLERARAAYPSGSAHQ
ncbi:hypothetical protein [Streptomyces yerevanensis]|uniref:hypothetical protein n=1 Tax=Streptomyces yerevanensis TaxID=66378 RepID=UPI000AF00A9B|nr:hypothetical protein [Streptomyces yerevanensis]